MTDAHPVFCFLPAHSRINHVSFERIHGITIFFIIDRPFSRVTGISSSCRRVVFLGNDLRSLGRFQVKFGIRVGQFEIVHPKTGLLE